MKTLSFLFLIGLSASIQLISPCLDATLSLFKSPLLNSPQQVRPVFAQIQSKCRPLLQLTNQAALQFQISEEEALLQLRTLADIFSIYDANDVPTLVYAFTTMARDLSRAVVASDTIQVGDEVQCLIAYMKIVGDAWAFIRVTGESLEGAEILLDAQDVNNLCPGSPFEVEDIFRFFYQQNWNREGLKDRLTSTERCLLKSSYVVIDYMLTMLNFNKYDDKTIFLHYVDIIASLQFAEVTCWGLVQQ